MSRIGTPVGERTLVAKTCLSCDELKLASHYAASNNQGYAYKQSNCTACMAPRAETSKNGMQERSLLTAAKNRDLWVDRDEAILTLLCRLGWSNENVAVFLGRTVAAVAVRKNTLGLKRQRNVYDRAVKKENNNG